MLVRRFLDRLAESAPPQRVEIVRALVRVYLEAPLDADNRRAAATALTAVLDDPAPRVRRAMADGLADSPASPHALVLALAEDQSDIAEIVLARSPVLSEIDLIDIAGASGERQRTAIASREVVGIGLAAALIEVSGPVACVALLGNAGATIATSSFRRLVERHPKEAALRSALLARDDLPLTLRRALIDGLSDALGDLVRLRAWLTPDRAERMLSEARERAVVNLSMKSDGSKLRPLVDQLAAERRLSAALVLRSALVGNRAFFEAALSVLSEMPAHRVSVLIRDRTGAGFDALYRRTGLPSAAYPAFRAVVDTLREYDGDEKASCVELRPQMIERVMARYELLRGDAADECSALIARLAAEAAREEARAESGGYFRAA